jgi:hypothetical protein
MGAGSARAGGARSRTGGTDMTRRLLFVLLAMLPIMKGTKGIRTTTKVYSMSRNVTARIVPEPLARNDISGIP